MSIDTRALEGTIRRRTGLMARLGEDVGRFLKELAGGGPLSRAGVEHTLSDLRRYSAECVERLEEQGQHWQKTRNQIVELKRQMKGQPEPIWQSRMAQVAILMRSYDGYRSGNDQLQANGIAAQILIEKLKELLILLDRPALLSEDAIDQWAAELERTLEEHEIAEVSLAELDRLGRKDSEPPETEAEERTQAREKLEDRLEELTEPAPERPRERTQAERRLEEEF